MTGSYKTEEVRILPERPSSMQIIFEFHICKGSRSKRCSLSVQNTVPNEVSSQPESGLGKSPASMKSPLRVGKILPSSKHPVCLSVLSEGIELPRLHENIRIGGRNIILENACQCGGGTAFMMVPSRGRPA